MSSEQDSNVKYHCKPKVKIIADSLHKDKRLTTFEVEFWRPILPEQTRHRILSYCFRSDRATPTELLIEEARNNPWGPAHWTKNQKGMVGIEITDPNEIERCIMFWKEAAKGAATIAYTCKNNLFSYGEPAKEIVNRILEPYISVKGIISGTDWDNFFKLRISDKAQGEMCDLARAISVELHNTKPTYLFDGEWHLPYISDKEREEYNIDDLVKASAARCARISRKAFDGTTSIEKDVELCNNLIADGHYSPLEMVAVACEDDKFNDKKFRSNYHPYFLQYRKVVENGLSIQSFEQTN